MRHLFQAFNYNLPESHLAREQMKLFLDAYVVG